MSAVRTILCPTDFAGSSEETFRAACQLARDRKARLIALHVAPKSVVEHVEAVSERSPAEAREKLWEAMRRSRPEEEALDVEHRLEEGDPAQGILRVAEETRCELVVMGMHERSGWTRWLGGGVAEAVIQEVPCSVMIVKIPGPSDEPSPAVSAVKETPKKEAEPAKEHVAWQAAPSGEGTSLVAAPARQAAP
jgi:nucleotide-binding universal stress UspA family protein